VDMMGSSENGVVAGQPSDTFSKTVSEAIGNSSLVLYTNAMCDTTA
jgi:hypothetical protein